MLKTDGLFLGSAHLLVFVDTESADRVCPQIRRTLYKECLTLLKYGSYEKQIIGCKRVNHKSVKLMKNIPYIRYCLYCNYRVLPLNA